MKRLFTGILSLGFGIVIGYYIRDSYLPDPPIRQESMRGYLASEITLDDLRTVNQDLERFTRKLSITDSNISEASAVVYIDEYSDPNVFIYVSPISSATVDDISPKVHIFVEKRLYDLTKKRAEQDVAPDG